jgi:hypothetical protein
VAANHNPKYLSDLARWEANLRVTCRGCSRTGDFDPAETARFFTGMGWSTAWGTIGRRFRCEHCNTKGADVAMVPKVTPRSPVDPPRPLTAREMKEALRKGRG